MSIKIENYWGDTKPQIGNYIVADGWGDKLYAGKNLLESDWDGCKFRIPMASGLYKQAVNIRVTGRTVQFNNRNSWVRIEIEFVGDDEPSTFARGWMALEPW